MRFRGVIVIFICALSLIQGNLNLSASEEDDSGSIELPRRPENRQAARESDGSNKQVSDPNTFLQLVSKFINTVKKAIDNTIQQSKIKNSRNGIQKSKKTLKGLYRAYNLAEKAQKQFMKHFNRKIKGWE